MVVLFLLTVVSISSTSPQQEAAPQELMRQQYRIRGNVTEAGLGIALANVEIAVVKLESGADLGNLGFKKGFEKPIVTDQDGTFEVRVDSSGRYAIHFRRKSFVEIEDVFSVVSTEHPSSWISVVLARENSISGHVQDRESQKPISGLRVEAMLAVYRAGNRILRPTDHIAITNADGSFSLDRLEPGEYFLEVAPKYGSAERFEPSTQTLGGTAPMSYGRTYWPGKDHYSDSPPLQLRDGQALGGIVIEDEMQPLRRLRVRLRGAECKDGDIFNLLLEQNSKFLFTMRARTKLHCNGEIDVNGLQNQRYTLLAIADGLLSGFSGQTVVDVYRDDEVAIDVHHGVNLRGQILIDESSQSANSSVAMPVNLTVRSKPEDGGNMRGEGFYEVDSTGAFFCRVIRPIQHNFHLEGLPNSFYVKEFKYRSATTQSGGILIQPFPMEQRLEIVLGTRPALLTGEVRVRSQPAGRSQVVLLNSALQLPDLFQSMRTAEDLGEGRYRLAGLAPGDYVVLAIGKSLAAEINNPGTLERLITGGTSVHVSAGESKTINLELIEH